MKLARKIWMDARHLASLVHLLAKLPLDANVQFMTVMATDMPPVSGRLSAALLFLYFTGGRDRTMIWDIHRNGNRLC